MPLVHFEYPVLMEVQNNARANGQQAHGGVERGEVIEILRDNYHGEGYVTEDDYRNVDNWLKTKNQKPFTMYKILQGANKRAVLVFVIVKCARDKKLYDITLGVKKTRPVQYC
eukprot:262123_1